MMKNIELSPTFLHNVINQPHDYGIQVSSGQVIQSFLKQFLFSFIQVRKS